MINLLLGLVSLALRVVSMGMLVYCVMSFLMPQHDSYRKLASYIEPILYPVRRQLYSWFPSLHNLPVDLSPLAVWLLIDIANGILNVLRGIF